MRRWILCLPALAAACIAFAAWHFGQGIDGYDHARRPLALLGTKGMPGWRTANLLLFVLPGAAVMAVAWSARTRLDAGHAWALRMALQLGLLAAFGHASQGLLNLDPARLPDDGANRWHAVAWMLWWMAFALSALLLAASRGVPAGLRIASAIVAAWVPLGMLGQLPWPVALVHRVDIALWLGWWAAVAVAISRGAVSATGSPPTTRR